MRHKVNKTNKNYICVDFHRNKLIKLATCVNVTYDPNRTSFVALIKYSNGAYSYILAPHGLINGSLLRTIPTPEIINYDQKVGCVIFLKHIYIKCIFYNLSLNSAKGAQYARSAGTYCVLLYNDFEKNISRIKLPSNKILYVSSNCTITLGRTSNIFHNKEVTGKAGKNVLLGKRPSVRGVAMNPVDHPHGGRTKTNSPEVTPWGKIAKFNK